MWVNFWLDLVAFVTGPSQTSNGVRWGVLTGFSVRYQSYRVIAQNNHHCHTHTYTHMHTRTCSSASFDVRFGWRCQIVEHNNPNPFRFRLQTNDGGFGSAADTGASSASLSLASHKHNIISTHPEEQSCLWLTPTIPRSCSRPSPISRQRDRSWRGSRITPTV